MNAENKEIIIAKIQARSNDPYKSITKPPTSEPTNAPHWWETITIPNKVDKYLVPKRFATIPEVGGTVESQRSPITQLKAIIVKLLVGNIKSSVMTIALVK